MISVTIPVYNSAKTLSALAGRLVKAMDKSGYRYELVFVDDGSTDGSWQVLEKIYGENKNIRIVSLNRNFGQHNALMCGFKFAKGDYIVTIDDDLQNPPEEIPKLVKKIEEGYDVVYGEYISKHHSPLRNIGSGLIQIVYKKTFGVNGNLTAFRIIRKIITDNLLRYDRNYTFIDGLIAWNTKNIGYVNVRHDTRTSGRSGYTLGKLVGLSFNMLTNFSIFPLQLASIMGFFLSFIGIFIALFFIFKKLLYGIPVTGFASIIVSVTLFSGAQLITIGLIGEYIGRIHLNINNKPQYIIRESKTGK